MSADKKDDAIARIDAHRTRQIGESLADGHWPAVLWLHDPIRFEHDSYIVHGLIEPGSLVVLYGDAGSGKSTIAVSQGMAVARGDPWRGRATRRGLVLHIAGEGARGLRLRQLAHVRHYDVPKTAPYAVFPQAIDLGPHESVREAVALVLQSATDIGEAPSLVIVDTLARCLRGDENSGADMSAFIAACDAIRQETGAAVVVIHHAGKDLTKGARGHSSLRAAADTELFCEGAANPRVLHVRKQRDLELAEPMAFNLEPVTLAVDDQGKAVTACVVVHDEAPVAARPKAAGRNQSAAMTALREWTRANAASDIIESNVISDLLKTQGIDRKRRPEVLNYLVNARAITPSVGGYVIERAML